MSFRSPSLLVNQTPNTMRRRSGGNPNHEPGSRSRSHTYTVPQFPSNGNDLMVQIEDTGELHSQPTVLLVRPSQQSPPLPSLPTFAPDVSFIPPIPTNHLHADIYTSKPDPCQDHATAQFSTIPLTPRPDAPSRTTSEFSLQSTQTLASQISRLPTPDFTDPKHKPDFSLHSYLPRRLSFTVFRRLPVSYESSSASLVSPGRPESVRSESDGSFRSMWSSASSSSIDTGHHSLIPSIGTTVKFTHKWPKPQSLRNLEVRGGSQKRSDTGLGQATILALEQGQGLGMDKIERWTSYKWCLLLSVFTVFAYGATGLVYAILTWFRTWNHADVMYVADGDILILITLASSILLFTALVGTTGAFLNSRPILAIYTLLLWPALISLLAVGYTSYKRDTFSLDHKLNLAWSQYYTPLGRLLVQDSLRCCGFYSALHEATPSKRCYPRASLPGCKGKLYRFEQENLGMIWWATFALAPLHIVNVVVALLCANHMTTTFGKGITPKKYRLSGVDVRTDAERILNGMNTGEVRPVVRPEMSRASSSGVFREDRQDRASLLRESRHG